MLCRNAFYSLLGFVVPAVLVAALPADQVTLTKSVDTVTVEIGGQPFGKLHFGRDAPKPYFAPLRSASGKIVTRQYPMVEVPGETHDHQHHRGLWLGYIDVNGFNFWENEFSYHRANAGRMVARSVDVSGSGSKAARIHILIDWLGPQDQKVLTEDRTMTFHGEPSLRIADFDATLTAIGKAVFGDDKDGALGVRMADKLTEKNGTGVITNSAGERGMKEVWGKRADWVDYSGTLDGEAVGIAIFDHPDSFHHPARWHARDYGLVAANPFADHAYDPSAPVRNVTLNPGQSVHLLYRIVVHGKMDRAAIEKLYKSWAGQRK
ncbi:MAG TPA: PmoA family protein [Bryobacteraceae bacterium]|nr:PmoA family protein [Bryobacteraceae bacterium]